MRFFSFERQSHFFRRRQRNDDERQLVRYHGREEMNSVGVEEPSPSLRTSPSAGVSVNTRCQKNAHCSHQNGHRGRCPKVRRTAQTQSTVTETVQTVADSLPSTNVEPTDVQSATSLDDRVDDLHARLQSQHSKQDVEMELEPDLAERVRRHNANRRDKMRSEDMLDELSEVRSNVSSSVVHPRSVASSARFW